MKSTDLDNYGLVIHIAKKYVSRTHLELDDLIQEGWIGLIRARELFDPDRGVRFSSYAGLWIHAGMRMAVMRDAHLVRLGTTQHQRVVFSNYSRAVASIDASHLTHAQRHQAVADLLHVPVAAVREITERLTPWFSLNSPITPDGGTPFIDLLEAPEDSLAEDRDIDRLFRAATEQLLVVLNDRERHVLNNRILAPDGQRRTLASLGKEFGVSRERVRQIEAAAMNKLRERVLELDDYQELRALLGAA